MPHTCSALLLAGNTLQARRVSVYSCTRVCVCVYVRVCVCACVCVCVCLKRVDNEVNVEVSAHVLFI